LRFRRFKLEGKGWKPPELAKVTKSEVKKLDRMANKNRTGEKSSQRKLLGIKNRIFPHRNRKIENQNKRRNVHLTDSDRNS